MSLNKSKMKSLADKHAEKAKKAEKVEVEETVKSKKKK